MPLRKLLLYLVEGSCVRRSYIRSNISISEPRNHASNKTAISDALLIQKSHRVMFAGEVLVKTSIHERASILPRTDAHLHRRKGWQPRMAFEVNELMRVESLAWGSLRKATRRRARDRTRGTYQFDSPNTKSLNSSSVCTQADWRRCVVVA